MTAATEDYGRRSLALCRKTGDRQTPMFVLTLLARTALTEGRPHLAGRLWGAVETEQTTAPPGWWTLIPDHDRYNRDRYIAELLAHRSPEFEQGRTEGRRLSLDDAINYVLTPDRGTPPSESA